MKIAYITSGAAGMYCGSCMRDNTLAAALNAQGHDCVLVPTYTPVRTDEPDVSLHRVFFGGIGIYLEQHYPVFRRMPGLLRRWLSAPALLRWASRFGMKVRPEDLGALTISMLQGTEGHQRRDLLELVNWLSDELKPDMVCLSNVLIAALTPALKQRLPAPVLCTLQGDDIYLDWLPAEYRQRAFELIGRHTPHIDGYLTTSRYYADFMAGYLGLPRERIDIVYPGLNLKGYPSSPPHPGPLPQGERERITGERERNPATIGYLARICPEKGLHVLVDAFNGLRQRPGLPACRLRVAGYLGPRDRPYLEQLRKRIEQQGWAGQFDFLGEVTHAGKIEFLRSLDVFSVPTTYQEPKGLYVLEAWACGVPVVQPHHGSFPELLEQSGGGLLVEPANPAALADALEHLLLDPAQRSRLGQAGREAVRARFHAERMAQDTLAVFQRHLKT